VSVSEADDEPVISVICHCVCLYVLCLFLCGQINFGGFI